ncbi:hypothetical protein KJ785_04880 [Patescibacteria group bacterium]|nr:hypothetical protein [Patescibacteria group bacterium]
MYLKWKEQYISDFSDENINSLYNQGYIFGRPAKGYMYQSRSLRIDLNKFELSSENKRILRKTENLRLTTYDLPLSDYHWSIGRLAKDFYETKFGKDTFSANKIKELLTSEHNFNKLMGFVIPSEAEGSLSEAQNTNNMVGYCIALETDNIIHYSYPFYNLKSEIKNLGMSMMLNTIIHAKKNDKKYIYLGSAKDAKAKYKLQFKGLEWFDGEKWSEDLEELKIILK